VGKQTRRAKNWLMSRISGDWPLGRTSAEDLTLKRKKMVPDG